MSGYLFERHNGSAKSDLNVVAKPRAEQRAGLGPAAAGDELTMVWEYSSDLYDAPTIARMWGHFQVLLAGALADDAARLDDLPLLTAAEIAQLAAWNGAAARPAAGLPSDPLRRLRGAGGTPAAAPAVTLGGRRAHLRRARPPRAELLARHLRGLGVGPEIVVAICAERSPEMVIAAARRSSRRAAPTCRSIPAIRAERLRFHAAPTPAPRW